MTSEETSVNLKNYGEVLIQGPGYELKWGLSPEEFKTTAYLRYEVFCRELSWVSQGDGRHETDEFDAHTVSIAVFSGNTAMACLRVHPPSSPWMALTVFRSIFPTQYVITHEKSCEVSRLAIAPQYRNTRFSDGSRPAEVLYRGLFAFSLIHNLRHVYMMVSKPVLRCLRLAGLPCYKLNDGSITQNGIVTIPACLDWEQFIQESRQHDRPRLKRYLDTWYIAAHHH